MSELSERIASNVLDDPAPDILNAQPDNQDAATEAEEFFSFGDRVMQNVLDGQQDNSQTRGSISEELNFEQRARKENRENKGIPPEGENTGFAPAFKAGFAKDPKIKAKIFSKALFPDDPSAITRFGQTESGQIVYQDKQGVLRSVNAPGIGTFASDAPIIAGDIIGGVAGSLAGSPVAGTVIGGGIGSIVKNAIGQALFNDETITMSDYATDLAIETTLGTVSTLPGKLATGRIKKGAISDISNFDKAATLRIIKDVEKKTGIRLDVAQASGLGSLRQIRKWATKYPSEAQNVMQAFRELQAGDSQIAVDRILKALSSESSTDALGIQGINAAKASILTAKAQRSKIVRPLYKKASESNATIDVSDLASQLDETIKVSSGGAKAQLKAIRKDLVRERVKGKDVFKDSIEELHNIKLAIDDKLETSAQSAIGSTAQRELQGIKNQIVDQLAEASPEYDIARGIFHEVSEQIVTPLEDSVIGVIAKIKNKDAATVSAKILSSQNADVRQVRFVKSVLKRENPEAFNGLVRQFIANNLDKGLKELQGSDAINIEGKLRQTVFGTPKQKEAMLAAFDGDAKVLFKDVMDAFELIKNAGTSGSDTAFNAQQAESMISGFPSLIRAVLSPKETVIRNMEQNFIDKNAMLIAEALTDPSKVKQLKQLRNVSGKQEAGLAILSNILGSTAGRDEVSQILNPPDTSPLQETQQP